MFSILLEIMLEDDYVDYFWLENEFDYSYQVWSRIAFFVI